jgi:hypothetical protein
MLQRGGLVPHFEVRSIDGDLVSYSTIWQRRNLVLMTLPSDTTDDDAYASELREHASEFADHATTCIVTRDAIDGLAAPGALVSDRWGEIVYVSSGALPAVSDLVAWVEFIERRCPECEGEAK